MWTCKNHQTGEVMTLHYIPMSDGDLPVTHPDWVHRQCGTESARPRHSLSTGVLIG
jgi:hypothetical protein